MTDITFGLDTFETTYEEWAKHHKYIGMRMRRTYEDGTVNHGGGEYEEDIKRIMEEYPSYVKEKHVNLIDFNTGDRKSATDAFLLLENRDYIEPNIEWYGVASNTAQTFHVRLKFQLEEATFMLDHSFKSKGSGAFTFYDMLDSMDAVDDIIEEVVEQKRPLDETGIIDEEDKYGNHPEEGDYKIIVIDDHGEILAIPVEKRELLKSLVGVELYQFDQTIND